MPWTTLLLFAMAIIAWRFVQNHPDDVGQFLGLQTALFCLIAAIVKAPLPLQGLVLAGLLIYPSCSPGLKHEKNHCPHLCLRKRQCHSKR